MSKKEVVEWKELGALNIQDQVKRIIELVSELVPDVDICNIKGKAFVKASGWDRISDIVGYDIGMPKWINQTTWREDKLFICEYVLTRTINGKTRTDKAFGVCSIKSKDDLENGLMKAETKARARVKRRVYGNLGIPSLEEMPEEDQKHAQAIEVEAEE